MLVQVLILAILSTAQATYRHGGKSVSSREDDGYGNYIFSYDIEDPLGATNGRYEIGDAYGNKKGGYKITDIDGRVRWVEYVADEHGFRVVVDTNEPGTAASRPASAVISSPYTENQPAIPVSTVKTVVRPVEVAPVVPIPVESVKQVHPVAVDHISQTVHEVPIGSVKGVSHPFAPVAPVPIGSVKGVSHPVAVAPVAPVPIGSVKEVHPIAFDHISQTVNEVPIGSVKGISHPIAVDHISQTVHEVPIESVKGVSHPFAVGISQTVHDVPISSVKTVVQQPVHVDRFPQTVVQQPVHVDRFPQTVVQQPVHVDRFPQTVVQQPVHVDRFPQTVVQQPVHVDQFPQTVVQQPVHVDQFPQTVVQQPVHVDQFPQTVVQQPVHVDQFPQTVQEIPFGTGKETLRPVKIAQTVYPPKKFISSGIHQVGPVVRRARTFREAQAAHAASLRPNLYNGEYSIKYQQPSPPIVKKIRPAKVHKYPIIQYHGRPNIDSLQLIDSTPIAGVPTNVVPVNSVHVSPVTHPKGTPFHQNGLLRHVYGSSLKKPDYFRSHLL